MSRQAVQAGKRTLPSPIFVGLALCSLAPCLRAADQPAPSTLERRYAAVVLPVLKDYCLPCHGAAKQEAKLDLSGFTSAVIVLRNPGVWDHICDRLESGEMPPRKATKQPKPEERKAVLDWYKEASEQEARRTAGDPGRVLARRLSNAEYDYTIRDLTGVDIRPTKEFPVDPANEAGFDNSGESLTMSPALLKKYLAAARYVADHLVLKPRGFVFAPYPAVTETDRDKYCVQKIIAFYDRQRVDIADYFLAAWRYRHREALGSPNATITQLAEKAKLSPKYLQAILEALTDNEPAVGPLAEVRSLWLELPRDVSDVGKARRACAQLRDNVIRLRKGYVPKVEPLQVKGISKGSQPLLLWRNEQIAVQHMRCSPTAKLADDPSVARFCRVFPDAFYIAERAPFYDAGSNPKGRLLSAGFHLMHGYYRDDQPLCELILDEAARRELDGLWEDLHFVALDLERQYKDFIFFERAEPPRFIQEASFDFARSEDKDSTSEAKVRELRTAYLAKVRKIPASPQAETAIEHYFANISAAMRRVEKARKEAEPSHLAALQAFAARAYRRPMSPAESAELLTFYRNLRDRDQLGHEEAMRDSLARILLAPQFCYRIDAASTDKSVAPLEAHALASRLSYFLWSSMPDDELLRQAAAGKLHQPEVLKGQARRMLRDPRSRALAEQFAGNWLEFRRFEESNTVDRDRFPSFTNDLRQAMAEEPVRFFLHVAAENRPALEFLNADYTFVNAALARHYGMPFPESSPTEWVRVDKAGTHGRGGLLPMAVFLTKNSPGLRTSPVKRGYWVVRRLLGERIPPPPPEVPELPKDEAQLGEKTLPQLLAIHRNHKACAGCHERFDSLGLTLDGFGPIGERRAIDLGGRKVDARAVFPGGGEGEGLDGLRNYLSEKRQAEFADNLCRKLFAYALGRSLVLSDKPTIAAMHSRLAKDGYPFGDMVEAIVTSPQFLNRRGHADERE